MQRPRPVRRPCRTRLRPPRSHRHARLHILAGLLLAAAAPLQAQPARPAPPPELAGLDGYIRRAMEAWEIPGVAIAVVRGDSVIFARGYGERRLGGGEPVDEHTLFAIASATKAFTATALGLLVDDGLVDWDDPVTRHLPGFRLADPEVTRQVTIRDLLAHRTGVARHDNLWIASPFDRAEIVRRARFMRQAQPFRDGHSYNSVMYMVAGEVAAAAAGSSWEDLVEARILGPLGMTRSTPRTAAVGRRGNAAAGHIPFQGGIIPMQRRDYDALGPGGSIFSSAFDLAQWVRFHLSAGMDDGRRLMDATTVHEMHRPQVSIATGEAARAMFPPRTYFAYGLGWRLHDYHGKAVVHHTGEANFTRTQVGMIPSAGLGVAILANLSTSQLQVALMYRVFDALLGLPPRDWSAEYLQRARQAAAAAQRRAAEAEAARIPGTTPSRPLAAYPGTYADSLYGHVTVQLEDGRLVIRYSPDYVADLEHWHHDTFRAVWRPTGFGHAMATFTFDAAGRVRALDLQGFATFGPRSTPHLRGTAASDGVGVTGRPPPPVRAAADWCVSAQQVTDRPLP
jgi:CubicO group peptidase (beta-lactamase class C family)